MSTTQNTNPILGYVLCHDCMSAKSIRQGNGKRSDYYVGRCQCGTDNRTAKVPQQIMANFRPQEEIEAELATLANPVAEPEPKKDPDLPKDPESLPKPVSKESQPDNEPAGHGWQNSLCIGLGCGLGFLVGKAFTLLRAA